jgi:VWFA-related protein
VAFRRLTLLISVLAWALLAIPNFGQDPPNVPTPAGQSAQASQATSSQPIRSTARLIQLSVVVQDKHGNPVTGLKKDDFVILDEKKPQTIQVFSVQTNQLPVTSPPALPPDFYTNRVRERAAVPTGITVILLDGLNTRFEDQTYARKQVIKFLQQIHPQDRIALYTLGSQLRVLHDFTSDSTSLLAALKQYGGHAPNELPTRSAPVQRDVGNEMLDNFLSDSYQAETLFLTKDRVQKTKTALIEIANHVGNLPGRKNLIWVSGSFPIIVGLDNIMVVPNENTAAFDKEIEEAARALNDANLAVYPVDARGLATFTMNSGPTSISEYGGGETMRLGAQPMQTRRKTIGDEISRLRELGDYVDYGRPYGRQSFLQRERYLRLDS